MKVYEERNYFINQNLYVFSWGKVCLRSLVIAAT